jgi:hypothetical protein
MLLLLLMMIMMIWYYIRDDLTVDRGHFLVYQNLFAASVRFYSVCQRFWINLRLRRSLPQMTIIKSRYLSLPKDEHLQHCIHLCVRNYESSLSLSYLKVCSVMHQLRNTKVNKKQLLISVNCFSLKRPIFNKWNNFTLTCPMLLCYISLPRRPNINTFCSGNVPSIVPLSNIGEMIKQKEMRMVWV